MAYRVSLTRLAEEDAYAAFERAREVAPVAADKWLRGLFAAIMTLANMPTRCPVIPEAAELGHEARHLLYGRRTAVYRIIFDIQEQFEEGPRVRVLRIWHGARDAITVADIDTDLAEQGQARWQGTPWDRRLPAAGPRGYGDTRVSRAQ